MTVILKDIPNMTSEEAVITLNSMMSDFHRVRLQVTNEGDKATQFLLQDVEIIDEVLDMIFSRINDPKKDLKKEIISLQKKANNADITVYHALSYDDSSIESNLKSDIHDISNINKKFLAFVKDKTAGDSKEYNLSKKDFLESTKRIKDKYKLDYSSFLNDEKLNKQIENYKSNIGKLDVIIKEEEKYISKKDDNMLPQLLTTVAIATAGAKLFNYIKLKLKGKSNE